MCLLNSMWITKAWASFSYSERLFISKILKITKFWLSSWYLSHLNLAVKFAVDAFDNSQPVQMLDTIWKLSVLCFSNVITQQVMNCQLSTSCLKSVYWEWERQHKSITVLWRTSVLELWRLEMNGHKILPL